MRYEDWPQRLAMAIETAQTRSFAYGGLAGTQDCALFAADCVAAITAVDYAAELRGYATRRGAYEIVARYGSLGAMATALLKREPIHPALAQRGDVVLATLALVDGEEGETLGICLGVYCAYPDVVGVQLRPRAEASLAWRID